MRLEPHSKTARANSYRRTNIIKDFSFAYAIVESDAFERLKKIRFLGAIDYLFRPNASLKRHTRHEHSLGVATLAMEACSSEYLCDLSENEQQHIVAAALLHDIGHAPLSHSLEPVFEKKFGINHHKASEAIIKGEAPVGRTLGADLKDQGLDLEIIMALISGDMSIKGHQLFSSKFNIDTIDGIVRSSTYEKTSASLYSTSEILHSSLRRNESDRKTLDNFWDLKKDTYNYFIQGTMGLLADSISKVIFSSTASSADSAAFYWGEDKFMQRHPEIFSALRSLSKPANYMANLIETCNQDVYYNQNYFTVDNNYSHCSLETEKKRYKRKKERKSFADKARNVKFDHIDCKLNNFSEKIKVDGYGIREKETVF